MSCRWLASEIYNISIYKVRKGGEIDEQPVVYQTIAEGGPAPDQLDLGLKDEIDVAKIYEEADWLSSPLDPPVFPTITLKE